MLGLGYLTDYDRSKASYAYSHAKVTVHHARRLGARPAPLVVRVLPAHAIRAVMRSPRPAATCRRSRWLYRPHRKSSCVHSVHASGSPPTHDSTAPNPLHKPRVMRTRLMPMHGHFTDYIGIERHLAWCRDPWHSNWHRRGRRPARRCSGPVLGAHLGSTHPRAKDLGRPRGRPRLNPHHPGDLEPAAALTAARRSPPRYSQGRSQNSASPTPSPRRRPRTETSVPTNSRPPAPGPPALRAPP